MKHQPRTPLLRTMTCIIGISLFGLLGCAHKPPENPSDPLEPINRVSFNITTTVDKYTLRPIAKAYDYVTPDLAQQGISNFFGNLFYPRTILNDFLQGKVSQGVQDTFRFALNTTLGLGGLFDVATPMGLSQNSEDFGQTLGTWGVGQGWYLVIPLYGPTTGRDFTSGFAVDAWVNPLAYAELEVSWSLYALNIVHTRAGLLPFDAAIREAVDPYVLVRTAYLQRRLNAVHDGNPPVSQSDDSGFEEEFEDIEGFE